VVVLVIPAVLDSLVSLVLLARPELLADKAVLDGLDQLVTQGLPDHRARSALMDREGIRDSPGILDSQVERVMQDGWEFPEIWVQRGFPEKLGFEDLLAGLAPRDLGVSRVWSEIKGSWGLVVFRDLLEHLVSRETPAAKELEGDREPQDSKDSAEILVHRDSLDLLDPLDRPDWSDLQDPLDHLVNYVISVLTFVQIHLS